MTVGVFSELIRGDIYYWGELMAGACLGSLPIVIAYVFFLDYYVSGLTAGAGKERGGTMAGPLTVLDAPRVSRRHFLGAAAGGGARARGGLAPGPAAADP